MPIWWRWCIPADSRVGKGETRIGGELNEEMLEKLRRLNAVAAERGQKSFHGLRIF